ncbi:hypothetical protein K491DRAFT_675787 [Lophiostoma macrostomum CBS 122681]|uniref:Uncharacterized protein n=1 Tax=Lophiostoma macrostomum CBS 122681 TaxID=1314788 RepID=A0A6A6TH71_9PLEO|nr:hypothetical protein K491DRAFT_675787 [Lophiostoma macrostomum CBS 122681]
MYQASKYGGMAAFNPKPGSSPRQVFCSICGKSFTCVTTATQELLPIFENNERLSSLVRSAIYNPKIGDLHTYRNLHKLIKQYSARLEDEAEYRHEYVASRIVGLRAKSIAETILAKILDNSVEAAYEWGKLAIEDSGNEDDEALLNENYREEISHFSSSNNHALLEDFLVRSEAFWWLMQQIQSGKISAGLAVTLPLRLLSPSFLNRLHQERDRFCMYIGYTEPEVEQGRQRLRWDCRCGKAFWSDVTELRDGGVSYLMSRMSMSGAVRFTSGPEHTEESTGRQFLLPLGGSVAIFDHRSCCTVTSCKCLPPEDKVEPKSQAEYQCRPIPALTSPPVPSEYLLHLFSSPACINENDTWILDQLPKRTRGELLARAGVPAEGWGMYYSEGWDGDKIVVLVFLIFLLSSILFGVLWSRYKMDLQGAFGVSAYIVSACGILLTLIIRKLDQP